MAPRQPRLDALVTNAPRPGGGSSDELMKAGVKVLRGRSRCARAHRHRPLDGLSMKPGTLSASHLHRSPRRRWSQSLLSWKRQSFPSPIPFAHVHGLIKDRSIVQSSLLRGQAQDALCYFTALARAEYLLRSLVGGSEIGGDACVTKSTLVPQTAKVTSARGFLKLVVCYTEAMGCRSTSSFRFRRRR